MQWVQIIRKRANPQAAQERRLKLAYSAAVYTDFLSHRISEIEAIFDDDPEILKGLAENENSKIPVFASSIDAVTVHREGRIVFANPAAAVIFGAETVGQLIGMDAIGLVHPNDRTMMFSRRFDLFNGRRLKPIRRQGLRLDGAAFTCESHSAQRILGGAIAIFDIVRLIGESGP
jgi:PAS domain-containing protein